MRIAFITDWMTSPGGADRLLNQLTRKYPDSEVFTTIYNRHNYPRNLRPDTTVHESFLVKFPYAREHNRHLNALSPLAFESFDLTGFDLVVSLSAGAAKGIIPQIDQKHVAIILTPPRSLWDKESNIRGSSFRSIYKVVSPPISTYLRMWDQSTISRVDEVISISEFIQKKVKKIYRKDSSVVYPGVNEFWFKSSIVEDKKIVDGDYFLVVSRLYDYKNVDWAIEAAKIANKKLVVVGEGPDDEYLRSIADENVIFLGWVTDNEVRTLYSNAQALLFCGIEDFGYVPVEAMASGCPVIAYNKGGVVETVKDGVSGEFFENVVDLSDKLQKFDKSSYNVELVKEQAEKFSEETFLREISKFIEGRNEI